ncbi:hypothetical protein PIB30_054228 [Stylosanthes scabra]|uniref:Uncharacterized protein n=1 Tax=Stylosanthes scabra TaxID=79078 RepID=A0ABU6WM36_9FABA|nr:hypothetical protein [Stylosanthes scabra]
MAFRGRSRRQAREDSRGEQADQAGLAAQAGPAPQEDENLHRLNRGEDIIAQAVFIPHASSEQADAVHDGGGIRACHLASRLRFRRSTHFHICGALAAGVPHVPSPVG